MGQWPTYKFHYEFALVSGVVQYWNINKITKERGSFKLVRIHPLSQITGGIHPFTNKENRNLYIQAIKQTIQETN